MGQTGRCLFHQCQPITINCNVIVHQNTIRARTNTKVLLFSVKVVIWFTIWTTHIIWGNLHWKFCGWSSERVGLRTTVSHISIHLVHVFSSLSQEICSCGKEHIRTHNRHSCQYCRQWKFIFERSATSIF